MLPCTRRALRATRRTSWPSTAPGTGSFTRDNIDIKGNYQASGKLSAFGRYSISPSNIFDPPALADAGGDALNGGQQGNAPDRMQSGIPSFQITGWANLGNPNSLRMKAYSAYAQDQWQSRNNLTINYGLRWEIYPFPSRDVGGVSRFDPADGKVYIGGNENVPVNAGASSGHGLFLPRLGATYRLNDKTVVRAGYGHSADPKPFIDFRNAYPINFAWSHPTATYNGATNTFVPVTTLRQGLNQAVYGVPPDLTKGILPLPTGTGTTTYPKEAQRKYIQSWNVAFQRELFANVTAQVAYVGTRAVGQQQFININASAPGTGNAGRPLSVFGIVSDINMIEPFKNTTYNALQADLRARLSQGQFGIVYTLSKAVNYADNDANPRIQWMPSAEFNKGVAAYDRTHNFQGYWVWDLPFGSSGRWAKEGIAAALLGGWQINGLMSIMSGTPINVVQDSANNLNAAGSGQYADKVKDTVEIKGGIGAGNEYFDRSAFVQVNIPSGQTQRFGNSGRNPIRGPGFFNIDLGVFRTVSLGGPVRLQIRAEALNVLNYTNFANPGGLRRLGVDSLPGTVGPEPGPARHHVSCAPWPTPRKSNVESPDVNTHPSVVSHSRSSPSRPRGSR